VEDSFELFQCEGATTAHLKWCFTTKNKPYPCIVIDNPNPELSGKITLNKKNDVIVQYLGWRHFDTTKHQVVPVARLRAYNSTAATTSTSTTVSSDCICGDIADDQPDQWDPQHMKHFIKAIGKQKVYVFNKALKFKTEELVLHYFLMKILEKDSTVKEEKRQRSAR
jgi:hypothetical protein